MLQVVLALEVHEVAYLCQDGHCGCCVGLVAIYKYDLSYFIMNFSENAIRLKL